MMVVKRQNGTTEQGTEYSVVVAKTSKSILPAKHTSIDSFMAGSGLVLKKVHRKKKHNHMLRWFAHLLHGDKI